MPEILVLAQPNSNEIALRKKFYNSGRGARINLGQAYLLHN